MHTVPIFWAFLLSLSFSSSLWARESGEFEMQRTRAIQALQPVVESTLREFCGSECLGYKIEPRFRSSYGSKLESLGFQSQGEGSEAERDPLSALSSASVQILVAEQVSQKARDTLREVLRVGTSNLLGAPAEITFKEVKGSDPLKEKLIREKQEREAKASDALTKRADPSLEIFKVAVWPLTVLILGGLAAFSLSRALDALRKIEKEKRVPLSPLDRHQAKEGQGPVLVDEPFDRFQFLKARASDLQWLIEEWGVLSDVKNLKKLVSLFSAGEVTEVLKLGSGALERIASLDFTEAGKRKISPEDLIWLEVECDRAHWKRQEEARLPLKRATRLPALELKRLFLQMPSAGEKALLLAWTDRGLWPSLLSQLSGSDRISVAKRLFEYEQAEVSDRKAMEAAVIQRMNELLQLDVPGLEPGQLVKDFATLLSDEELKHLPHEVRQAADGSPMGQQILSSSSERLAEVALGLDSSSLIVLARTLNAPAKAHLISALPKHLKEKVIGALQNTAGEEVSKELEFRARGKWLARVREIEMREQGVSV